MNRLVSPFRSSERGLKMFCSSKVSLPTDGLWRSLRGWHPTLTSSVSPVNTVAQPLNNAHEKLKKLKGSN